MIQIMKIPLCKNIRLLILPFANVEHGDMIQRMHFEDILNSVRELGQYYLENWGAYK